MARFGKITFLDPMATGSPSSGGIFFVNRPSPRDATHVIDGRWTVHLQAGSLAVVACGGDAVRYEDALLDALGMAQRGLDIFSILGVADLAVSEADNEHIVWWPENSGVVLRIHENHCLRFQFGGSGTVTDPSGKPIPPQPPPNYSWHESYRYFRLSQATDDLYDAYRNLFLALESILSTIEPVKLKPSGKPAEGEGAWLKRAIRTAAKIVDIKLFVPTGTTDPEDYLFKDIYEDRRTALFHAKKNRTVFLPHGASTERNLVTTSLVSLADFYLALIEAHLGVRRGRSSLSLVAFEKMADIFGGLAVTDSTEDLFDGGKSVNTDSWRMVRLNCRWATELDEKNSKNLLGSIDVSRTGEPAVINQVVVCSDDGTPRGVSRLKEILVLQGINRVEVQFSQRFKNNEPKKFYGM